MFTKNAIHDECFSATLVRARDIARKSTAIIDRRVEYGRYTNLDAFVGSSASPYDGYDVSVTINEASDQVVDYSCSCPAYRKYPGMCKHCGAVALAFLDEPETFAGYSGAKSTKTSPSLSRLLAKSMPAVTPSSVAADSVIDRGSLALEMTFDFSYGMCARFKIVSLSTSYVIKNISEFLRHIENREYFEYGKKLAFTHALELFTPQAQRVIHVLKRLASPDEYQTSYGRSYRMGAATVGKELPLSQLSAIELLDAYGEVPFYFDDGARYGSHVEIAHVEQGNPPLDLEIQPIEGGYEILRTAPLRILRFDERAYVIWNHTFYRCDEDFSACTEFLEQAYCSWDDRLIISEDDLPAFCSLLLPHLQKGLRVDAPEQLRALQPIPCQIQFYLDKVGAEVECRIKAVYGLASYNPLEDASAQEKIGRDLYAEAQAVGVALRFLPVRTHEGALRAQTDDQVANLLFHGLQDLKLAGEVFTTPAFDRMIRTRPPRVTAGVSLVGNLINMKTQVTDLPPEELYALLDSYRHRRTYHRLHDGSLLDLTGTAPADMGVNQLESLCTALGITERELLAGSFDLPLYQAFLIDAELEDQRKDTAFQEFIRTFESGEVRHHTVPRALTGVLRPYQKDGFAWLNLLSDLGLSGILADDMGLGKSLQVISYLLHQKKELDAHPALIVCPASLVYNWKAEFAKFAPGLRVRPVAGSRAERSLARGDERAQALITSYDSLRSDAESWQELELFACVIDEAQYIKNHNTRVARAVKKLTATHRLALTGTPIENRLSELWSIFDFLMPGMLGSYNRFKERYELPILGDNEQARERLRHLVGPFILRRRKADVLQDLPDKLEQVILCKMDERQRQVYDAYEQRLRMQIEGETPEDLGQQKIAILAELTHLRQICCDPRLLLDNHREPGIKMEAMLDLIANAMDSGQKVLLFSQFTSYLDLIAKELRRRKVEYFTITGDTPKRQRVQLVDRFNGDETPVFLISLKAGGTGLNLTGASVVIHADPWWNEAAQRQATDRAHRIGQQRTVTVYQVIAENTIEERILKLQQAKSNLADQVLGGAGGTSTTLGSLSREDLVSLLSEG